MRAARSLAMALLSMLGAFLAGCGTLNVSVSVLDPDYVRQQAMDNQLRKLYRDVVMSPPGALAAEAQKTFDSYGEDVVKLADRFGELAAILPGEKVALESTARTLRTTVAPHGDHWNAAQRHQAELERLAQQVRTTGATAAVADRKPMPFDVRQSLLSLQAEQSQFVTDRKREIEAYRRSADAAVKRAQATAANKAVTTARAQPDSQQGRAVAAAAAANTRSVAAPVTDTLDRAAEAAQRSIAKSIVGDDGVAATEFAYILANAPENLWEEDFNRAYARGSLGNVDMVIRMNATADFSVKGLLFDASKVAQVASKVLTQSVLLGAQMAGVPVRSATTGTQTGGDALSASSSALAQSDTLLATREAKLAARRQAMRSFAQSLLTASTELEGPLRNEQRTDAGRKTLHDGIDASLTALHPLLAATGLE